MFILISNMASYYEKQNIIFTWIPAEPEFKMTPPP